MLLLQVQVQVRTTIGSRRVRRVGINHRMGMRRRVVGISSRRRMEGTAEMSITRRRRHRLGRITNRQCSLGITKRATTSRHSARTTSRDRSRCTNTSSNRSSRKAITRRQLAKAINNHRHSNSSNDQSRHTRPTSHLRRRSQGEEDTSRNRLRRKDRWERGISNKTRNRRRIIIHRSRCISRILRVGIEMSTRWSCPRNGGMAR
jgi:hypothetical protein